MGHRLLGNFMREPCSLYFCSFDEARVPDKILADARLGVRKRVEDAIAAHARAFGEKSEDEQAATIVLSEQSL